MYLISISWVLNVSNCVREHLCSTLELHLVISFSAKNQLSSQRSGTFTLSCLRWSFHLPEVRRWVLWFFMAPIFWPPYHSENLSQFSWTHRFSMAQDLPFEHDASFWGLEDSHTCLLGFRIALKVSIIQPLGFAPAPTPLTFDYVLHKCFGHDSFGEAERYQGEEGTKGPRLQWLGNSGGSKIQANHHLSSPLCTPTSFFSHENKVIRRGNIWLLWADFICPSPPPPSFLSLPLPLGSCILHSYSISLKSLLKGYYPIYRPYGMICPSSSLWPPCTRTELRT